jgi:hypothetical protein
MKYVSCSVEGYEMYITFPTLLLIVGVGQGRELISCSYSLRGLFDIRAGCGTIRLRWAFMNDGAPSVVSTPSVRILTHRYRSLEYCVEDLVSLLALRCKRFR